MDFGVKIRRVIKEKGITQSELGRQLGTTSQSVNGWCNFGVLPRKDILEKLPEISGRPLFWFFTTDEEDALLSSFFLKNTRGYNTEINQILILFFKLDELGKRRFIEFIISHY